MTSLKRDTPDGFASVIEEARRTAQTGASKLKILKGFSGFSGPELVLVVGLVGEWITDAIQQGDVGVIHACLGSLEQMEIGLDILKQTGIGRLLAEQFKMCQNEVAVARARKIITTWKSSVESPSDRAKRLKQAVRTAETPNIPIEIEDVSSPQIVAEDPAVDALASMLDNLPELDAMNQRKKITWKPELVQLVEFGITDTCEELRQTIKAGRVGGSLHHTYAEQSRFAEQSRRERAMGGKGLGEGLMEEEDLEAVIEYRYPQPRVVVVDPSGVFSVKNLKSYERQDLADLHGGRPETLYLVDSIPDTPCEPSTSSKFHSSISRNGVTVDVFPSGIEDIKKSSSNKPSSSSFEEEFVKLDSELQTAIMASEALVKIFSEDPILLRDVTVLKIREILNNLTCDDRKPSVSTIMSSQQRNVHPRNPVEQTRVAAYTPRGQSPPEYTHRGPYAPPTEPVQRAEQPTYTPRGHPYSAEYAEHALRGAYPARGQVHTGYAPQYVEHARPAAAEYPHRGQAYGHAPEYMQRGYPPRGSPREEYPSRVSVPPYHRQSPPGHPASHPSPQYGYPPRDYVRR